MDWNFPATSAKIFYTEFSLLVFSFVGHPIFVLSNEKERKTLILKTHDTHKKGGKGKFKDGKNVRQSERQSLLWFKNIKREKIK